MDIIFEPARTPVDPSSYEPIKNKLPNSLFTKNRQQFISIFKKAVPVEEGDFALFRGASEVPLYSSDVSYPEYQEACFYYLFGVHEMDCYAIIDFYNEKAVLFAPKLNNLYKIWMTTMNDAQLSTHYGIEVRYLEEIEAYISEHHKGVMFVNEGVNSDSGLTTMIPDQKYLADRQVDRKVMHDILAQSRVIKNDEEIHAMRWASQITAEAHCNVLKNVKQGMRESQVESLFTYHGQQNYYTGRVAPYLSICGCGPTAATLHYHDNDKFLRSGQMMLTDQGHSFHHYVSDVTICFPVDGKFTHKQAEIYTLVLKAARNVFQVLKPGVSWVEMHELAERTILSGLKDLGCLNGDVDEMQAKRIGFIFMPHGLGHLIGLDVHDVGGYLPGCPERSTLPGLKSLRTSRTMQAGMCITIEPGCYFRDFLLNGEVPQEFYQFDLSYLNLDKIREYQAECAGVRIEDVVLITENGCENLSFDIPRTVSQIEKCMSGKEWRD